MRALVLHAPHSLSVETAEIPACPDGWALVKVLATSICGSDFHAFRGGNAMQTYPRLIGHETCGTVEKVSGGDGTIKPGDKVILMPYISCGHCSACRRGKENACTSLSVFGVHREGTMAEYFSAPLVNLVVIDSGIPAEHAALLEPMAISTHAVSRSGAGEGSTVLVSGAGFIGLAAALMARIRGARVFIADTDAERRRFAGNVLGPDKVLDPLHENFRRQVDGFSNNEGPEIIIDATGNHASMENDVFLLANGGRIVYVGISKHPISLHGAEFHKRETELLDSRAAKLEDFEEVIRCLKEGLLDPGVLITHRTVFDGRMAEQFKSWNDLGGIVFKAVVSMA